MTLIIIRHSPFQLKEIKEDIEDSSLFSYDIEIVVKEEIEEEVKELNEECVYNMYIHIYIDLVIYSPTFLSYYSK